MFFFKKTTAQKNKDFYNSIIEKSALRKKLIVDAEAEVVDESIIPSILKDIDKAADKGLFGTYILKTPGTIYGLGVSSHAFDLIYERLSKMGFFVTVRHDSIFICWGDSNPHDR